MAWPNGPDEITPVSNLVEKKLTTWKVSTLQEIV
jgi:hypothetical protein